MSRDVLDFDAIRAVPLLAVLEKLDLLSGLRRRKSAMFGSCPICQAKSRKAFTIGLNQPRQLWRCFAPEHDSGGDVLTFVQEYERVEINEAAERVARWFAIASRLPPNSQRFRQRSKCVSDVTPKAPTHKVYAATKREGQKDFLTRIGSAWPFQTKDKKSGLNILLTAMPIGDRMVLFEADDEPEAEEPAEKKGNGRKK